MNDDNYAPYLNDLHISTRLIVVTYIMKITVIIENTTINPNLHFEHGLSLYIETKKHKILFDAGASDKFADNARKLGIDLSSVDIFVLSHGHNDHGGGLPHFLSINDEAKIYVQRHGLDHHFSKRVEGYVDIGVNLTNTDRITFVDDELVIDDELRLFSRVKGNRFYPRSNSNLFTKVNDDYLLDDFIHEQNLIINEFDKHYLIAGCAHKGMVNIIEAAKGIVKGEIEVAIGGLHLFSHSTGTSETSEVIEQIGSALLETNSRVLTCHCTGEAAHSILKPIMKEKIEYIRTGTTITLD